MPSRQSWRRAVRVAVAVAAGALALAMAGCESEDGEVLARDPLATEAIDGLSAVSDSTMGSGGADIKETHPTHRRTLRVEPGLTGEEALDRVAETAEQSGWTVGPRTPSGFSGTKTIDGREATVKVALTDAAGHQELTLVLMLL